MIKNIFLLIFITVLVLSCEKGDQFIKNQNQRIMASKLKWCYEISLEKLLC